MTEKNIYIYIHTYVVIFMRTHIDNCSAEPEGDERGLCQRESVRERVGFESRLCVWNFLSGLWRELQIQAGLNDTTHWLFNKAPLTFIVNNHRSNSVHFWKVLCFCAGHAINRSGRLLPSVDIRVTWSMSYRHAPCPIWFFLMCFVCVFFMSMFT